MPPSVYFLITFLLFIFTLLDIFDHFLLLAI